MTTLRTVAALYVDAKGCYADAPGVELWDVERDARGYEGPHPVVAHPPCTRWCRLASLVEARWGHRKGLDSGMFASALQCVRIFGGVLEHPAYTAAWPAYHLDVPRPGGWQRCLDGGWVCHVEQGRYGHPAKKATWLYAYGASELPSLDWSVTADQDSDCAVRWHNGNPARIGGFATNGDTSHGDRRCLTAREASATPVAFRDTLLAIARSVTL